jgi:hypothetical protein
MNKFFNVTFVIFALIAICILIPSRGLRITGETDNIELTESELGSAIDGSSRECIIYPMGTGREPYGALCYSDHTDVGVRFVSGASRHELGLKVKDWFRKRGAIK